MATRIEVSPAIPDATGPDQANKNIQTDMTTTTSSASVEETASTQANDDETAEYEYPGDIDCIENTNPDDGLLRAVLEELDSERAKRIQLEIQFSELPKNRGKQPKSREEGVKNDQDQEQDLFESQNHSLSIAHQINSIFSNCDTIHKRNLSTVLSALFNKLFDNTIVEVCGLKHDPIDQKSREKRTKDAIYRVVVESDGSIGKRLLRTEYNESMLIPILLMVATDFVKSLIQDMKAPDENSKSTTRTSNFSATTNNGTNPATNYGHEMKEMKQKHSSEIIKISTERDGYLNLIDALTSDTDAVTLAAKNTKGTLPLHIVRFLEIMPEDDRAQDYISMHEEVHQWQAFDVRTGFWSDKKTKSSPYFRQLPIHKMGSEAEVAKLASPVGKIQQAFDSFASSGRVLTNHTCSHVLDLTNGYPLPEKGTWEWISSWCLADSSGQPSLGIDNEGWTYSDQLEALLPNDDGCRPTHDKPQPTSRFRKRIWKRSRVLISYPGISQRSRQMLKKNAHSSKLTIALSKLHDQVHDMQNTLIQKEEMFEKEKAELKAKISTVGEDAENKQRRIDKLQNEQIRRNKQTTKAKLKSQESEIEKNLIVDKLQNGRNEKKEIEKLHIENTVIISATLPKLAETQRIPLISLEDVKIKDDSSKDESTPKKKESTPEKKETSQVVVHKIPNQSNSPPSLSFLFKSASMKDESGVKPKIGKIGAAKVENIPEQNSAPTSFSFLFNSKDTTTSFVTTATNSNSGVIAAVRGAPQKDYDRASDTSKLTANMKWMKGSENILESVRTNVQTVITNVDTISREARERVNSKGSLI